MKLRDGSPTICSLIRCLRQKVDVFVCMRDPVLGAKMIKELDAAMSAAKRMQGKLESYKAKEEAHVDPA